MSRIWAWRGHDIGVTERFRSVDLSSCSRRNRKDKTRIAKKIEQKEKKRSKGVGLNLGQRRSIYRLISDQSSVPHCNLGESSLVYEWRTCNIPSASCRVLLYSLRSFLPTSTEVSSSCVCVCVCVRASEIVSVSMCASKWVYAGTSVIRGSRLKKLHGDPRWGGEQYRETG